MSATRARLAQGLAAAPGYELLSPGVEPDATICIARPFIAGETLAARLERGPIPVGDAVTLGLTLARVLEDVHAAGVVHRGIKPSNIVFPTDRTHAPVLVDLGVASPFDGELSIEDVRYLAPEQSGTLQAPLDARADLYSIGVVLYRAVTGRAPFDGHTINEILRQHLVADPPLVGTLSDVPIVLERMIARMLHKDPRDRYQTAAGVRSDFEELENALATDVQPHIILGTRDRRAVLTEPAFVGRTEELGCLDMALAEATAGAGGVVLVEADSGLGKTRLLDEFGRRARSKGAWVLHGRGIERTTQPFQVLTSIAHALLAAPHDDGGWKDRLRERLGASAPVVSAILPELASILGDAAGQSLGPDAHAETRSLIALCALLDALGTPEQPVVWLLDDAQWADDFTVRLLTEWQSQRSTPASRFTLVLVAFRSEQVPETGILRTIRPLHHVVLAPFDTGDVREQIASMVGQLPEAAIEAVLRYSTGNPFLVVALVHGLVETGALGAASSGWEVDDSKLSGLHASNRMADVLALRVELLPPDSAHLLRIGALLGCTFDCDLVAALAGTDLKRTITGLETCRGRLVWADARGRSFTFVHDRIREALLVSLSGEARRRLHRLAAEHFERTASERIFDLAYHFDAAADHEQALPHALAAADHARERFAFELAERNYRIAMRGEPWADRDVRFRIASGLAETLTLRGRYDEGEQQFARALELAREPREAAIIEERWAQLSLKRGDLRAACEHGEAALRRMGRWVPRANWSCTLACTWELAVQVLHTYMPALFIGRRPSRDHDREQFVLHLYNGMNGPYFFSKGPMWAGWAHLRHLNLAERAPASLELARAYATHAATLSGFPGLWERGLRVSKLGAEMCARLGDPSGEAEAWTFHSMMLHFMARFDEAIAVGRKASALYDRTGDRWLANSGLDFAVTSLLRKGDLEECVRLARHIHERASSIGDAHALAWSLDAWSRATEGRVPREFVEAERARSREHLQTSVVVSIAEGVLLLGEGRPDEAEAVFANAVARVRKELGFFHDLSAPVAIYLVTAIRRQIEKTSPWHPRLRRRLIRRGENASRQALKLARRFENNLPHALREAAYLAALNGDERKARRLVDESIAVASRRGQRYDRVQSRLARAEIGGALGWSGADDERREAGKELDALTAFLSTAAAQPEEVTLSLLDRYATVLDAGHRIATALSPETIYSALHAAALALLRAERCAIFRTGAASQRMRPANAVYGDVTVQVRDSLIAATLDKREPVVFEAGPGGHTFDECSSLCAPIFVRGTAFAVLVATHQRIRGVFDQEARRIARFLVTLAGAALENAEGFAQIQALSRTLEIRVEERTAQLSVANTELEKRLAQLRETQDQLIQAGKLAAIGTLVSGLSHELNNPLTVILGFTQILLDRLPEHDDKRASLESIERNALRCRKLVKALLDFSRPGPAERSRLSPRMLVDNVVALTHPEARGRSIAFAIDVSPDGLPDLFVSQQEIESALLNLLSNALYATPQGGSVTLRANQSTDDGISGIEFSIRDTGTGIPSSVLAQIFDPFFTTKPVGEGTGLGLTLTRRIVETHEGKLAVETEERKGTLVRLWLPLKARRDNGPSEAPTTPDESLSAGGTSS